MQVHIGFNRYQVIRQRQLGQRGLQVFADLALDFRSVFHHTGQRAVGFQPFHRRFRAALLHARHVVHLVAHQREIIADLVGAHAEFFFHAFNVQRFATHRIHQRHALVYQLSHVLIAGGHHHVPTRFASHLSQSTDNVVRFHLRNHQYRPAHQAHQIRQGFRLRAQIVRHRRTRRLIVGKHLVAEIFALRIKHHRAIVVHIIRPQTAQHVQHAIHRPRRCTVGRRQILPHSMIGAVKIRRAVNEKECGFVRHGEPAVCMKIMYGL